jgi:tyrosine-protein phosphatase SIW14
MGLEPMTFVRVLISHSFLRSVRFIPILLLFALSVRLDANIPQTKQETQTPKVREIGRKLEQKGVPNFGEVTPTLYRGGLLSTTGIKALKKLGMDVIVDTHANDETEQRTVEELGMKYVAIPWHCPWPHDEVFAKFLKVVHDNHGKKIFVHCRLGDDRTGMMVAAYRMAEEGWTAEEAMNEMRSFGFSKSHHFICPSLAGYEKHFPEHLKNHAAFAEERARHAQ